MNRYRGSTQGFYSSAILPRPAVSTLYYKGSSLSLRNTVRAVSSASVSTQHYRTPQNLRDYYNSPPLVTHHTTNPHLLPLCAPVQHAHYAFWSSSKKAVADAKSAAESTVKSVAALAEQKPAETTTLAAPTRMDRARAYLKFILHHLKEGTKELIRNTRTCIRLVQKQNVNGHDSLTRAERRLMQRTAADLQSFLPFATVLIVLPEIMPLLVMVYPKFLPSVYTEILPMDKIKAKELQKRIKAVHKLHDMCAVMPFIRRDNYSFFNAVDTERESAWRSFLSISNMPDTLLRALCEQMSMSTGIRPAWYLRYRLDNTLRRIHNDDKLLAREGVESLTLAEIDQAFLERKLQPRDPRTIAVALNSKDMRARGEPVDSALLVADEKLRLLSDWVTLSTHPAHVPRAYLVLYNLGVVQSYDEHKAFRASADAATAGAV